MEIKARTATTVSIEEEEAYRSSASRSFNTGDKLKVALEPKEEGVGGRGHRFVPHFNAAPRSVMKFIFPAQQNVAARLPCSCHG